ncbi:MAG: c-type cytochrome domain-containing protein, partial [Planctomycetota bacterium]|nr:c-type cytochrome domain-containing protein [Planctomycetota bacterium]
MSTEFAKAGLVIHRRIAIGLVFLFFALLLPESSAADKEAERLFAVKILPLLKTKCFGCHGGDPDDVKGGFDIRSRAGILKGGESETAAIVSGKPEASQLYSAIKWEDL